MKPLVSKTLYRCTDEQCGRTSYIEKFCPHCARARVHPLHIAAEPSRPAITSQWRCTNCLSERILQDHCIYCNIRMAPVDRTTEAYVDGFIRDVNAITGEVVPIDAAEIRAARINRPKILGYLTTTRPIRSEPLRIREKACRQYGYASGCIIPGCTAPVHRHHMVPQRYGGTNAVENIIMICKPHEDPLHFAGVFARMMVRGIISRAMLKRLKQRPDYRPEWVEGLSLVTLLPSTDLYQNEPVSASTGSA